MSLELSRQLFRLALSTCLITALCIRGGLVAHLAAQVGITDPIVNATDTTAHDTQSTTAIVAGSGSNVIAAFTNTALNNGINQHQVGFSRSTNGGATWTDGGVLPTAAGGDFGFPSLARDQTSGKTYLSVMPFAGTSTVQMFESIDDGQTWASPVNAMPGFGGNDRLNRPRMAVDNFPGPGLGNVYVVAENVAGGGIGSKLFGVYMSRSTDGGATFALSPATPLSTGGKGPTVVVGPDHAVYVFWWINFGSGPLIRFVKSTNFGVTFGPITTAATLTGTGPNGDLGLGFDTDSFPQVTVSPVSGIIVVAFNDKAGSDRGNIYLAASGDGGATWDNPSSNQMNDDGTTRDQFMPTGSFTPDGKHVILTWYDRRGDPANSLIERWGVIATFGDPTGGDPTALSPNFRISTGSWPAVVGQDSFVSPLYMGAYDSVAADNNFFYVAWGDNRLSDSAHTNQPDVRVATIPVTYGSRPRGDFNGDGKSDLLWRETQSGAVAAWFLNGATVTQAPIVAPGVPVTWQIVGVGDLNRDGTADLVWRHSQSGDVAVWLMTGAVVIEAPVVAPGLPLSWQLAGVGDLDGDGKADLVWRNTQTGDVAVWLMDGTTVTQAPVVAPGVPLSWQIVGVGDLDGNTTADLVWRDSQTGDVAVWLMDGATIMQLPVVAAGVPLTWQIANVGDLDGDGKIDLVWRHSQTGDVAVWLMDGLTVSTAPVVAPGVPLAWQIVAAGDVDGDGKADLVWRHTQNGDVAVWLMNGVTVTQAPILSAGVPLSWQIQ